MPLWTHLGFRYNSETVSYNSESSESFIAFFSRHSIQFNSVSSFHLYANKDYTLLRRIKKLEDLNKLTLFCILSIIFPF